MYKMSTIVYVVDYNAHEWSEGAHPRGSVSRLAAVGRAGLGGGGEGEVRACGIEPLTHTHTTTRFIYRMVGTLSEGLTLASCQLISKLPNIKKNSPEYCARVDIYKFIKFKVI